MVKQHTTKDQLTNELTALQRRIRELEAAEAEHKRVEDALRESEELSRILIEAATVGTYIIQDGRFLYINPEYAQISGYTADELLGTRSLDYIHPDDKEEVRTKAIEQLKGQSRTPYMYRFLHKDGGTLWILERVASITYKGQRATVGSFMDITERKRAEDELRRSETSFRNIIEKDADGMVIVDRSGIVLFANSAAETLFGRNGEELTSKLFGFPMVAGEKTEIEILGRHGGKATAEMRVVETEWEGETGYLASMRDITESKRAEEALRDSFDKLQRMVGQTVNVLASVVEVRDPTIAGHQRRVAHLVSAIASEMGLAGDQIVGIYMAGLVHDVATVYIPSDILTKPARLDEAEFSMVKDQPRLAYDILRTIEFPWPVAEIVLQHRERMDGSGYPAGLSGEDILLEARILGVADVVEAMTSNRPHRSAPGIDAAIDEISKYRGILYDPVVVDTCLRLFNEKKFNFD